MRCPGSLVCGLADEIPIWPIEWRRHGDGGFGLVDGVCRGVHLVMDWEGGGCGVLRLDGLSGVN